MFNSPFFLDIVFRDVSYLQIDKHDFKITIKRDANSPFGYIFIIAIKIYEEYYNIVISRKKYSSIETTRNKAYQFINDNLNRIEKEKGKILNK